MQFDGTVNRETRLVLIVTGLSGAGKSVMMRSLEDLGFYCVDNLPVSLVKTFLKYTVVSHPGELKVALGIDARDKGFLKDVMPAIAPLHQEGCGDWQVKIIFLQSSDKVLLRRFQETRRRHPLATNRSLQSAIEHEKKLLEPIRDMADIVFDTDSCNIHELRKWVRQTFIENRSEDMVVNLVSFGFKFGVPAESNLVFDLRFLPNPYFTVELRALSGKDASVQGYLFAQEAVKRYWEQISSFLHYSIEQYYEEGRFFVNVAIGCSGGRHRSVAFVERLATMRWPHTTFLRHHRDIGKEGHVPHILPKQEEGELQ